jgi:hypothetical protein
LKYVAAVRGTELKIGNKVSSKKQAGSTQSEMEDKQNTESIDKDSFIKRAQTEQEARALTAKRI